MIFIREAEKLPSYALLSIGVEDVEPKLFSCVTPGGAGSSSVRSGTPDSVGSAGSAGQQPRSQYQYAGQPGYQHSHNMPGLCML